MTNHKTAILLFSRSAAAEAQAKGFGGDVRGTERLATHLIERTESTLVRTGLPVFRSDELSQRGNSFGERLTGAMAEVYARGYERLLVVGNDCPSIRISHLRAAAQLLEDGRNVLGPDRRGGVWLLGMQREDFAADQLAALSWQSADLYAELAEVLPDFGRLSSLVDLNFFEDLRRNWFRLRHVFGGVGNLVFSRVTVFFAPVMRSVMTALGLAVRGPPSFISL